MKRRGYELLGYVVLVAGALAVRLIGLDDRPFHHDESQDAYFSWLFFTQGEYEYQPILHGPLRFYLTSAAYVLFGDSDFTARLAPALMGTLMVPLPYLLRAQLGRVAAFAAASALAFGPTYLYYSRFAREDIYIACITLALLAVTFRFLDRPRRHQPALIGALLALSFATKESTFITVFVAGTFFVAALAFQARRHGLRDAPLVRTVAAVGWEPWAWGLAAFVARLHRAVHGVPHEPGRAVGRHLRRARLLARAARAAAAASRSGSSTSSCCSRRSGRRCCSARSARSRRCGGRRCCACS